MNKSPIKSAEARVAELTRENERLLAQTTRLKETVAFLGVLNDVDIDDLYNDGGVENGEG